MSHLMNNYNRLPITFTHGEGVWLHDTNGLRYLDALSGVAVNGLGHAHPVLVSALQAQVAKLIHTSNIYEVAEQIQLADKLAEISGMDNVFFCNSGCEANEAAIKLARLHAKTRNIENPEIVVMERSFHGRTFATLSATGNAKVQAGFEPLMKGFIHVEHGDLDVLNVLARYHKNIVAILVEPVQGEGGIIVPNDLVGYFKGIRAVCDANNWLMMVDEVQTGIGRTGEWFGFQHADILPDVATLAKGLGSGVPIGACLAKGAAAGYFTYGKHGSTFGGGPLATTAGLITLNIIETQHLRENALAMGEHINTGFRSALAGINGVVEIRNAGLMIGIELAIACGDLVKQALAAGLLINVTADKVIRLLPPLIINAAESDQIIKILAPLIKAFLSEQHA